MSVQHTTWTPIEREEWINEALISNEKRCMKNGYISNLMMKQVENMNDNEDPRRNIVTSCLAQTLYGNHPIIKRLSLCFYKSLMLKIQQNTFLTFMYKRRNFIVMIKGSNAYKILLRHVPHDIEHSDLDVVMFINPQLEDEQFEQIRSSLVIMVSQVMSRYKKDLDATLFTFDDVIEESILRKNFVNDFKEHYKSLIAKKNNEKEFKILTPFESKKVRNFCSKRSFIILNSISQDDHVVRVEIPHMNKCEYIPLKKTPLVFSYNKTIEFKRDIEGNYIAKFDLLRLRLNNMLVPNDEQEIHTEDENLDIGSIDGSVFEDNEDVYYDYKKCRIVPADFIDVSIPYKNDADLLDFWNSGGFKRCYEIYDKFIGANIMIPNVNECIRDLSNILNVYTNSHMKIEKRQKRLEMFQQLDENRKKQWTLEQSDVIV
jgi:hypothetical protein